LYRATGASFIKAQAEFTSTVMNNEGVRNAAAQAAAAGVRNTFSGQGQVLIEMGSFFFRLNIHDFNTCQRFMAEKQDKKQKRKTVNQ